MTAVEPEQDSFPDTIAAPLVCWLGALFTGPVAPAIVLVMSRHHRESPTRAHAIAATVLWTVALGVYLPVFVFAIFLPSLDRDSGGPSPWAFLVAAGIAVSTWTATLIGLVVIYRQHKAGAWSASPGSTPPTASNQRFDL